MILRALSGLFFNVPLLVVWILISLLCIGAGKVRLHYHAYLKAAARNDSHAHNAMANELTLIHGVPPGCDERDFLRELQNALVWINFRFYLAPLFWLIVGASCGPVLLAGYAFLRATGNHGWRAIRRQLSANNPGLTRFCMCSTGCRCARRGWCTRWWGMARKPCPPSVCLPWRSPHIAVRC